MANLVPSFPEIEIKISQLGSGAGSLISFSTITYQLLSPEEPFS